MWKRSFQVLKLLNWLGLTPTVHPFQPPPPPPSSGKKKNRSQPPLSHPPQLPLCLLLPARQVSGALNEGKCPVDGFHRWSVEIGRIGFSHRPFLGIQQKPPNKSTKIPKITKGKRHLSFTLGLWGNISLASLLLAFTRVNTREAIHISLHVKGPLEIRKQFVVPLSPSCWMVRLTNTGGILQLAKKVNLTSRWMAEDLTEYTCAVPFDCQTQGEMISCSCQKLFLFVLFPNQWNTALSRNADRSSLERAVGTERPSVWVWDHLRVNDRRLRKFTLKAHRGSSPCLHLLPCL